VQIQAWTWRAPDAAPTLETLELDAPREDEVVVRIVAAGVCHTDLIGPALTPLPAVFGHEGAGIVEAVGARVRKVRPGDRVALTFGSCGACAGCRDGAPAYCEHSHALNFGGHRLDGSTTLSSASGPVHGAFFQQSSFASHALATERNVVPVPADFPLELAAPLGCGIQTGAGAVLNTLAAPAGSSIAVFGAGSVGLSALMAASIAGCGPVIAVDIRPERLALALELGATHTIDARAGGTLEAIRAILPAGVQYSVETAGTVQSFNDAIDCLAKRGICGLVTVPLLGKPFEFSPLSILKGRSVVGVLEGSSDPDTFIPRLMALHREGRLPYDRFCRRYAFSEVPRALADAAAGRAIKPIIC
jgi:aryl-alcohol dehydrogenase